MNVALTCGVILVLVAVGVLTYIGLRDVARRKSVVGEQGWRNNVTLSALVLASLAGFLFAVYAIRNIIIGGDPNIGTFTLVCIRLGNYLSLSAIVLSLAGKGKGRWSALFGGVLALLLWIAQGISL